MKKHLLFVLAAFTTSLALAGPEESMLPPPPHFSKQPPPPNKLEHLKHILLVRELLMLKYDTNGDEVLDSAEKAVLLRDAEQEKKNARQTFLKRYDLDGDGKLSREERETMRSQMNRRHKRVSPKRPLLEEPPPPRHAEFKNHPSHMGVKNRKRGKTIVRPSVFMLAHSILIKQYDTNSNGIIDFDEFEKIRKEADQLYAGKAQKMLTKYDTNGDGILSDDEKKAIVRKKDGADSTSEQNEALDDIDLFIQESFDEEILECLEEDESSYGESQEIQ